MPVKPLHTLLNLLSLNVALKTFLIIMCLLCVSSSNVHGMRGCLGSAPGISERAKGESGFEPGAQRGCGPSIITGDIQN